MLALCLILSNTYCAQKIMLAYNRPGPNNLCIVEHKLRILFLYKYSTLHLELLTTPAMLIIEIIFTSSAQALITEGAGVVCGENKV